MFDIASSEDEARANSTVTMFARLQLRGFDVDLLRLDCGHSVCMAHDDDNASLVGAMTRCTYCG